jgi:arachidonate 5-lipoxygenase
MHAMCSDAALHEMVYHLQYTHLAMEPIAMAFFRQLPAEHPVSFINIDRIPFAYIHI